LSQRVVLHVGAMKTGTTFLQTTLERNGPLLEQAGVDFTGGRFAFQTRAVSNVLNLPPRRSRRMMKWRRLVQLARESEHPVSLVSMEFLSFAEERQVRAFLQPLAGLEVEVVMTVRDQLKVIPAQWQTYCRNHGTADWGSYLREIEPRRAGRPRSSPAYKTFHRAQDVAAILDRWSGPAVTRQHVVTVPGPEAPQEELWNRFFDAVGVPAPRVDFGVAAPNTSLGYGSCDLLRRLNAHLADVPGGRYRGGMRRLAREVLAPRRDEESRPVLDRRAADYARSRNQQLRESIERRGIALHGDVEDLPVPDDLDDYPRRAVAAPRQETLGAAAAAWEQLARVAGAGGPRPSSLRGLVAADAQLLRRVHGWG
jgi:hypothetical protein